MDEYILEVGSPHVYNAHVNDHHLHEADATLITELWRDVSSSGVTFFQHHWSCA